MTYPIDRKPPFVLHYQHRGRNYVLNIMADSWEDAEKRIKAIGATGEIVGSNAFVAIRANALTLPFATAFVAITCWWRNLWGSRK